MGAMDEKIMQDVLEVHLNRINVSDEIFQRSLLKHMGNPSCLP
jgi:hypothetical protein